jgi:putative PIN family toxin of toxin-antitoxin system
MKVVLDTNVIISGFLWKGKPFELLERIDTGEAELLTSVDILEEVEKVLEDRKLKPIIKRSGQSVKVIMNKLYSMAHVTPMTTSSSNVPLKERQIISSPATDISCG